ncbi:MAG: globin [Gordonia amarae]
MQQLDTGDTAVLSSLELYGEHVGDPTEAIYQRFFAKYPEAEEMFAHDRPTEERMMSSVLMMISDLADHTTSAQHSIFWITDHLAWDVSRDMMFDMFEMIRDTIHDGLGGQWTADMDAGWHDLLDHLKPTMDQQITELQGYRSGPQAVS